MWKGIHKSTPIAYSEVTYGTADHWLLREAVFRGVNVIQVLKGVTYNDKSAFHSKLDVIAVNEIGQCAFVHPWCD